MDVYSSQRSLLGKMFYQRASGCQEAPIAARTTQGVVAIALARAPA
jgi:hypothetical protein